MVAVCCGESASRGPHTRFLLTLHTPIPAAQIPLYGIFLLYTKLIVPFVLGGRDPISGLIASLTGRGAGGARPQAAQAQQQQQQEEMSKRQKKLQARADRGDPRVQSRQQQQPRR